MAKPLSELKAKLNPGVVAAADLKAKRMLKAMDLADFRKHMEVTQAELAYVLNTKQANISQIEKRFKSGVDSDIMLKTIDDFISALGCDLEMQARLPNGDSYPLKIKKIKIKTRKL